MPSELPVLQIDLSSPLPASEQIVRGLVDRAALLEVIELSREIAEQGCQVHT